LDVNVSFLQELLGSIADRGRALLPRSLFGAGAEADVEELSPVLISGRGEASGVAIASELLDRYAQLDADDRLTFFRFLATELKPDEVRVAEAAQGFSTTPATSRFGGCRRRSTARGSSSSTGSCRRRCP
jgi:malonyl-CoA decarboxylase